MLPAWPSFVQIQAQGGWYWGDPPQLGRFKRPRGLRWAATQTSCVHARMHACTCTRSLAHVRARIAIQHGCSSGGRNGATVAPSRHRGCKGVCRPGWRTRFSVPGARQAESLRERDWVDSRRALQSRLRNRGCTVKLRDLEPWRIVLSKNMSVTCSRSGSSHFLRHRIGGLRLQPSFDRPPTI